MKRYTVYDTRLGRYVVPLSRPQGEPPEVKTLIGGPQDLLFGVLIDHLAGLEIAAEAMEKAEKAARDVRASCGLPTELTPEEVAADPSVLFKPKRGKWKEHFGFDCWHYDCPFCEDGYATSVRDENKPNFCPNCGADMREEANR